MEGTKNQATAEYNNFEQESRTNLHYFVITTTYQLNSMQQRAR